MGGSDGSFLFFIFYFFNVGHPKESIFFEHLLWSIFQSSLHICYRLQFCMIVRLSQSLLLAIIINSCYTARRPAICIVTWPFDYWAIDEPYLTEIRPTVAERCLLFDHCSTTKPPRLNQMVHCCLNTWCCYNIPLFWYWKTHLLCWWWVWSCVEQR